MIRISAKPMRQMEDFYNISPYIAEFWNTLTNLPFILFGSYHIIFTELHFNTFNTYILLIMAGIASAYHHATPNPSTIIIDYIPIILSIAYILYNSMVYHFSYFSWILLVVSIGVLIYDNKFRPFGFKGHCVWHFLIAITTNNAYQDYNNYMTQVK